MENQNEFKSDLIRKIIDEKSIYDRSKLLSLLHDITSKPHVSISNPLSVVKTDSIIFNNFSGNEPGKNLDNNYASITNDYNNLNLKVPITSNLKGPIVNDMHHMYVHTNNCIYNKNNRIFGDIISSGKIARASAYVYVRYPEYRDMIDKRILNTLVFWNKVDPVDNTELVREAIVHKYQHNHNPFILIPELIEIVFSQDFENYNININTNNINDIRDIFHHKHTKYTEPKTQKPTNNSANESIDKSIDKLKSKALRNLHSIQTAKKKKDRDKLKKHYKKIKKQLIALDKSLEQNFIPSSTIKVNT